jgi:ATP-dependent protease ClpP protease subunit
MDPIVSRVEYFNDWSVRLLQDDIKLAKSRNQRVLPILLNSYGGSVYHLLQMIDALEGSGLTIVTICNGIAMSAGAALFAVGSKRYLSKNSTIMIHDASYMTWGKHSETKALVTHIDDLNNRLYSLFDTQSKKEKGYFKNLVTNNNGADLYFNSEQALEHGLATDIGVPNISDVLQTSINNSNQNKIYSEYENYVVLMQYSGENKIKNEDVNLNLKEGIEVDLETLLASLNKDQKKPIEMLQAQIKTLENEVNSTKVNFQNLTNEKALIEDSLKQSEKRFDSLLIDSLVNQKKLSKVQADFKKEILAESSGKAKELIYKELQALSESEQTVISNEIKDFGEKTADLSQSKEEKFIDGLKKYATANKLDLSKATEYQKAYVGYKKELEGVK